jgi:hypothetical protein
VTFLHNSVIYTCSEILHLALYCCGVLQPREKKQCMRTIGVGGGSLAASESCIGVIDPSRQHNAGWLACPEAMASPSQAAVPNEEME